MSHVALNFHNVTLIVVTVRLRNVMYWVLLHYDRQVTNSGAETPVKFRRGRTILSTILTPLRLREIVWKDVLSDIKTMTIYYSTRNFLTLKFRKIGFVNNTTVVQCLLSNWSYSPEMLEIRIKIGIFLSSVILKFDGWPRKIIGHFFYTTVSFGYHFKAIGEFKLKLNSGNTQFGDFFVPCDLEIWWITPINNWTPLLYHIKPCAPFQSHWWIQTSVTVRKR